MEFKIYLHNKIDIFSLIDEDDYKRVNSIKWYLDKDGYARNPKYGSLHRFIINAKQEDFKVDHINRNRLDNRKSNLRFVTSSQNSQNKSKKKNCSSKYIGVSYEDDRNKWRCYTSGKYTRFDKEEHAAYWYDQIALEKYGSGAKINNIEKPDDFIEPIKKDKNLPIGIYLNGSGNYKTCIRIDGKLIYLGTFKTIDEAQKIYNLKKEELDILKENDRKFLIINRNKDNVAIIKTSNGNEILVNDNKYHDLIQYTWEVYNGYAQAYINGKTLRMHRYLINVQKEQEFIDHINNNKLDNRIENLRKVISH